MACGPHVGRGAWCSGGRDRKASSSTRELRGSISALLIPLIQRKACFSQRRFWKGQIEASGKPWEAFLEEEVRDEEEEEEDGAMLEGSLADL